MVVKILIFQLIFLAVTFPVAARSLARGTARLPTERSIKAAALARARERVLTTRPLALFYYSGDSLGMPSLQAHSDAITLLAPQCYELDGAGALHGKFSARALEVARGAGLPLMPLVTNSGFDRLAAHQLLQNAKAQARAATNLAEVAERDEYVGWQLDLEDIDPADESAYTRFTARVAGRLHHDQRLLSVAVVPRFSDRFPDSSKPGFHTSEWGAAYDFRGLGRIADFLAGEIFAAIWAASIAAWLAVRPIKLLSKRFRYWRSTWGLSRSGSVVTKTTLNWAAEAGGIFLRASAIMYICSGHISGQWV